MLYVMCKILYICVYFLDTKIYLSPHDTDRQKTMHLMYYTILVYTTQQEEEKRKIPPISQFAQSPTLLSFFLSLFVNTPCPS